MANEGGDTGVVDSGQASGAASGSAGSSATGSAGSAGSTGSGTTPVIKWEDDPRAKGMLADLQRERKARQDYERQYGAQQERLAERERQIAALTNSRPPSKEEEADEAVKARFLQLFPQFANLTDEKIEKLIALSEQGEQLEATTLNHWTNHGRRALESVHTEIAKELGDLTDRQKKRINAAYVQEAESDPQFLRRHEAGDPSLVKEFVKNYLEDFVDPIRRKVTQTEVNRQRPVPFGKDRSIPGHQDKRIDVTDDKAVMDLLMESRQGRFAR